MTKEMRKARRAVGLPKFEKECRYTYFRDVLTKAYKVPATREHGEYCNLRRLACEIARKDGATA